MFTYRPYCDGCRACVPLRVPVATFEPTRSQRRAWKAHQQPAGARAAPVLRARALPALPALPGRPPQRRRHGPRQRSTSTPSSCCKAASTRAWSSSASRPTNGLGALKMVSILDILNDGLSAVYTFYEPEPRTSYGTYNVMWQIEQTRAAEAAARLPRLLDRRQRQDGLQGAVRAARAAARRALAARRRRVSRAEASADAEPAQHLVGDAPGSRSARATRCRTGSPARARRARPGPAARSPPPARRAPAAWAARRCRPAAARRRGSPGQ